jgi:beta-N-acetylhexosaminidase
MKPRKGDMRRFLFFPLIVLGILLPLETGALEGAGISGNDGREYAMRLARALDDRTLAGQTLLTGIDGKEVLGDSMAALLRMVSPGGILLFRYNLSVEKSRIAPFLDMAVAAASGAEIPPFMAVDHEGGWVHRFGEGVGRLPAPGAYWETALERGWDFALEKVETEARASGEEIRELGITLNLAPVAEVLTGENRAFLEERSYGPNPLFVERAAAAFIRGMDDAGISCALKHFPGNTGADPHEEAVVISSDREGLNRMTAPMTALIKSGIPAVMVSHALVPALDTERIASLSPRVIGTWLRGELGFDGIVLADDFSMGAAAGLSPEEAVVAALNAGVDMVMTWPRNLTSVHNAILAALREGRLGRERLVEAAGRILYEKLLRGIISQRGF